ncbi:MAG: oligosaccharide flippase family protein [Leifsonia sp.]
MTARDAVNRGIPIPDGPDSKVRRLSHGATWSLINTLVTRVAGLAVTVVVVRIVSPHDFGVFTVAAVVYAIVSSFGELGLSACILRRDVDASIAAPVVTLLSMTSGVVLSVTMVLLAKPLATALGAPEADSAIRVLAISVFLSSLTTVSYALLARDFRQGRLFSATAIAFVPANALLVVLALHGDGAMAFAWSRVAAQVITGAVVIIAARPWYAPRWNRKQAAIVLRFGLPLAGANLLNYTLLNADFAFIGSLLGATLLGIYTLAFSVASWSTAALASTINGVAMPAFSALRSDPSLLRNTLARWSRLVALVAFPVAALTAVTSAEIVNVLYGDKWAASAPVLATLSIYGAVFVISLLLSNLLVGLGRTGRVFIIQAVWLLALLAAVWLGVTWMGVEGAAIAHVVVIVVIVVPTYLLALRPVMPSAAKLLARAIAGPLAAAVLAGCAAYLVMIPIDGSFLRLASGGCVGLLIYLIFALPMIRVFLPARVSNRLSPLLDRYDAIVRTLTRKPVRA